MRVIITEFYNKIKLFFKANMTEVGVSLIIIFVAISSFFLGQYSVKAPEETSEIMIENMKMADTQTSTSTSKVGVTVEKMVPDGQVVASKSGKRYYFPWCGGVSRISEKNKIFFASALEAQKSGLTLASGCK